MPSPTPGGATDFSLRAVAATSSGDAWAVGNFFTVADGYLNADRALERQSLEGAIAQR